MHDRRAISVVDLAYGDCGKGAIVDFLARRYPPGVVVRFNGGPQAGHNVVTRDGREHTFSQFGAGTFVGGVRTLLSRFMLIEPYALFNEAAHLNQIGVRDAFERLTIDARCAVITPPHRAANRLRELARGSGAHGTCGIGFGETVEDSIEHPELTLRAGELLDRNKTEKKLRAIRDLKVDQLRDAIAEFGSDAAADFSVNILLDSSWIENAVNMYAALAERAAILDDAAVRDILGQSQTLIFEGAQGVLLDEHYGFHPHTTWSNTTFANAESLLNEAGYLGPHFRVGVLRTYCTRHGAGPLVTEDPALKLPERHNEDSGCQGHFRQGTFDAVAARYALAATSGVDALAITHLDRWPQLHGRVCNQYRDDGGEHASEDLFVRDRGRITDIRLPARSADSLPRLQFFTQALQKCRPIHERIVPADSNAFLDWVSGALGAKVGIQSSGPTAEQKLVQSGCAL